MAVILLGTLACQAPAPPPATDRQGFEEPEPSCLEEFESNKVDEALNRCNARVRSNPGVIAPLNDRALVLSLAGQHDLACADVETALELLRRDLPASSSSKSKSNDADPMLRHELEVRQATCKQRRTIEASD